MSTELIVALGGALVALLGGLARLTVSAVRFFDAGTEWLKEETEGDKQHRLDFKTHAHNAQAIGEAILSELRLQRANGSHIEDHLQ